MPLFISGVLAIAACAAPRGVPVPSPVSRDDPFLDTVQTRTFGFFWQLANPQNGLVPDRSPTPSFSSVAAIGFGLAAYPVGVERGWVTRTQARDRVLTTLRFLWNAPQGPATSGIAGHMGFFYHFLDMQTGHRFQQVELSTIDTALLIAGALVCREFFDGNDAGEIEVRALVDSLYRRIDWPWASPRAPLVSMGWHPETGFHQLDWKGYNEAMLLYILALGSPTHPVPPAAWPAWTATYEWTTFQGQPHLGFPPLFGHQYSHVFIDFRGIQDAYMRGRGIDYFENSRRATYSQRSYAIANPGQWRMYSDSLWGLTASDGPIDTTIVYEGRSRQFRTYAARGAGSGYILDDGTLVPTAAGGSVPFAPEITVPALKAMRRTFGDALFSTYGFLDAFNPTLRLTTLPLRHGRVDPALGWFDGDYLGIDQGPILLMIENWRSDLVWRLMRRSPYIKAGLCRAGFSGGWLAGQCQ
ncbi:MAG TPA: glucoamylase family protein [Gemmatimonadaceae bacterium]|nr:glucoamylase family protein [Gemmatimonadaceae bacterium]